MKARYAQRLTRGDVGRRVTIRRWVEDEERGARPSDLVGRLVVWSDDDVLTVVKRDTTRHEVHVSEILTSATIPEHPRLAPEPFA